ncbi:hypothetical protein DAI22_06g132300 [Oryza sativa Japonica Group]|uniref:Uncharacterized protein n=1 Tax=Oryza sativa subsp. japonica TaxID=39947 RepID=Q5Z495_ORYSJ|nr:hypothetical protein DAI22_06g132300 [Oryza sativa Japonica Group]BAD62268.1 hypothetical protein [Oryza sativa Japonica Group]BAD62437.1 hypothetical protein [Oryza sativa Japonica Group]
MGSGNRTLLRIPSQSALGEKKPSLPNPPSLRPLLSTTNLALPPIAAPPPLCNQPRPAPHRRAPSLALQTPHSLPPRPSPDRGSRPPTTLSLHPPQSRRLLGGFVTTVTEPPPRPCVLSVMTPRPHAASQNHSCATGDPDITSRYQHRCLLPLSRYPFSLSCPPLNVSLPILWDWVIWCGANHSVDGLIVQRDKL